MAVKLTLSMTGYYSKNWPKIKILLNDCCVGTAEVCDYSELDFILDLSNTVNRLEIHYVDKTEQCTITDSSGNITQDQSVKLQGIRLNDILLDDWMINKSFYYPDYTDFPGYLEHVVNPAAEFASHLHWFFPGRFIFAESLPSEDLLWYWYRDRQRYVYHKKFEGKSGLREENYIGSYDPCSDIINEIKGILDRV